LIPSKFAENHAEGLFFFLSFASCVIFFLL